jgi:hypothetical protein
MTPNQPGGGDGEKRAGFVACRHSTLSHRLLLTDPVILYLVILGPTFLSYHFPRLFIFSQPNKFRMPQVPIWRSFCKLDLGDQSHTTRLRT